MQLIERFYFLDGRCQEVPRDTEEYRENCWNESADDIGSGGDTDGLLRGVFGALCCFLDGDGSCWSDYHDVTVW